MRYDIVIPFETSKLLFRQVDIGHRKVWDLRDDVTRWCKENLSDYEAMDWNFRSTAYPQTIAFETEMDAVQFKLRWSNG